MKMPNRIFLLLLLTVAVVNLGITVNAAAPTLDELLNGETAAPEPSVSESPRETQAPEIDGGLLGKGSEGGLLTVEDLEDAARVSDADANNQMVSAGKRIVANVVATAVPILSVIALGGMLIITLLDIIYILIPPIRGYLTGSANGAPAGAGQGVHNGMSGYNGHNGGYGMQSGYGGSTQAVQQNTGTSRCWVTTKAIQAVALGSQPGQNGKVSSPLVCYAKSMAIVLVLVPVLLTLTVTGVMTTLGFSLAEKLTGVILGVSSQL